MTASLSNNDAPCLSSKCFKFAAVAGLLVGCFMLFASGPIEVVDATAVNCSTCTLPSGILTEPNYTTTQKNTVARCYCQSFTGCPPSVQKQNQCEGVKAPSPSPICVAVCTLNALGKTDTQVSAMQLGGMECCLYGNGFKGTS